MEEEIFDYGAAIAELEEIAARVEDPSTGLDDMDRYIERTVKLTAQCREYLRSAREQIDRMDNR